MEALTVRGTQIKRIGIKNAPNKTNKHKFQFILQLGKENGENIISMPNSSNFHFQTQENFELEPRRSCRHPIL